MNVLGIETSCDETAAAVVADGRQILSNIVASQVEIHARYGGVVPEVASRQHLLTIVPVIEQAMTSASVAWRSIGAVAVTNGPGLAGSLLVGINAAKSIAAAHHLPLVGVNHLEGHIYANWLVKGELPAFPALCLIVSGGHSDLVVMNGHGQLKRLGRTRDDAAGEAFDKAARILGIGYPGGPAIEKAAQGGNASLALPRAWLKGTDDFSFSGLKTGLFNLVRERGIKAGEAAAADAAASFQEAVVEVLAVKTVEVAKRLGVKNIVVSGGVAANKLLRRYLIEKSSVPVFVPPVSLCTDNAAMIASCGYYRFQSGHTDGLDLDVVSSLAIGSESAKPV
ncbi:MAG: tRNA (adenosine(37)-N6)-threonylcarbamoyltransferase complex transferase subunit TsaD [Chloroflexota bacterium]